MDIGHPTKNKKQERDEYCRTVDTLLKIKKQDRDEYCWTVDTLWRIWGLWKECSVLHSDPTLPFLRGFHCENAGFENGTTVSSADFKLMKVYI